MDHTSVRVEEGAEEAGKFVDSGSPCQKNHRSFNSPTVKITLLLALMAVTCLVLLQSSYPASGVLQQSSYNKLFSWKLNDGSTSSPVTCDSTPVSQQENEEKNRLKRTLKKAAMADGKTVIITSLNAAWTAPNSIFDLFLESFRIGNQTQNLLKHVVVGALDQTAYTRCTAANLHCFAVSTAGVNFTGEAYFMTDDYLKMVLRKIDFLATVLEVGFDFIFTDADVMWLRNPFDRFYPDADFQVACDHYWLPSEDLGNSPNTGFHYVKSNNRTIEFYKYWYRAKDYFPGKHDQDVLNMIKFNPFVKELGIKIRFLSTAYFGGYCEPSKDLDVVVTMHANCCSGLENKIHDLNMTVGDWKKYMAGKAPSPSSDGVERNDTLKSWTVPRRCG